MAQAMPDQRGIIPHSSRSVQALFYLKAGVNNKDKALKPLGSPHSLKKSAEKISKMH